MRARSWKNRRTSTWYCSEYWLMMSLTGISSQILTLAEPVTGLIMGQKTYEQGPRGANDFVLPGINGEVVPTRDSQPMAEAILRCWERSQNGPRSNVAEIRARLSV